MASSKWNLLWCLPWMLVTFLLVELLVFLPLFIMGLPLLVLGLFLVPTVMLPGKLDPKFERIAFPIKWLDAWVGNYEDGLCPPWWVLEHLATVNFVMALLWFLRNPVCNLRFCPVASTKPSASKVRWIGADHQPKDGEPAFYVCWQGAYVGMRWQCKTLGMWLGWKVIPSDRNGVFDYRAWGIGTACQLLRFKEVA
jgi:hypothetical protein